MRRDEIVFSFILIWFHGVVWMISEVIITLAGGCKASERGQK